MNGIGCRHVVTGILPTLGRPRRHREQKAEPRGALEELLAGNRRFTSGRTSAHRRDLAMLQQMLEKQEPFAAILSCADSRVPVEVVFDQTIGQLFVTRVAGNIVTPEIIASSSMLPPCWGPIPSWSWAMQVRRGHGCDPGPGVSGQISKLFPYRAAVEPATIRASALPGPDLEATIRRQCPGMQADRLRSVPAAGSLMEEGKLKISAAYFDIRSGMVTLLDGNQNSSCRAQSCVLGVSTMPRLRASPSLA
jgi:carbonic anhydrase